MCPEHSAVELCSRHLVAIAKVFHLIRTISFYCSDLDGSVRATNASISVPRSSRLEMAKPTSDRRLRQSPVTNPITVCALIAQPNPKF